MSRSVLLTWDESLTGYDFGSAHPLNPIRVELTMRLIKALGLLDLAVLRVERPQPAHDALLGLVHDADYIKAVRLASEQPSRHDPLRGLGTPDNPTFAGMHDAAALVAGATVSGARAVWTRDAEHAINIAGGLHHAMPGSASGFCIYNDPAVAIAWLLRQGAERVAYVDVDVHHGDGVEAVFWDDPRVLTISLHESGRFLFPGTGFPEDVGGEGAQGGAVNVALPPGTDDAGWLRAFHAVVPGLLEAFRPEMLVTQHGCDSHALDPLAHLALTLDGQRTSYAALHELAHRYADGRWLATGGGGYQLVEVVPRAWAHLVAEAAGAPLSPETEVPAEWRSHVAQRLGVVAPRQMTDGVTPRWEPWPAEGHPSEPVDSAIAATLAALAPFRVVI
jgi:acetoin utilization protein AcuC